VSQNITTFSRYNSDIDESILTNYRALGNYAKIHIDPSNRLATVHQRHTQDRQTDRQTDRTDNGLTAFIGRAVLQTVA